MTVASTPRCYGRIKDWARNQEVVQSGGCLCPLPGCNNAAFYPPAGHAAAHIDCPGCLHAFCRHCMAAIAVGGRVIQTPLSIFICNNHADAYC